jgi:hypothetical protein
VRVRTKTSRFIAEGPFQAALMPEGRTEWQPPRLVVWVRLDLGLGKREWLPVGFLR